MPISLEERDFMAEFGIPFGATYESGYRQAVARHRAVKDERDRLLRTFVIESDAPLAPPKLQHELLIEFDERDLPWQHRKRPRARRS